MRTLVLTCCALAFVLCFSACNEDSSPPAKRGLGAEDLFWEYQVWGDEERGEVTVLLQVRLKNNKGAAIRLEPPGSVKLDGKVLLPDSSRMGGVFYEARQPLEGFAGRHTLSLTDENKIEVTEAFVYAPFRLTTPLQGRVGKKDLVLSLSGVKEGDRLRVTLVDTVFRTADINEVMPVQNGRLHITPALLRDVAAGPVTLLIFKEEERSIHNPGVRGGKMAVTYGLMREFDLVE